VKLRELHVGEPHIQLLNGHALATLITALPASLPSGRVEGEGRDAQYV